MHSAKSEPTNSKSCVWRDNTLFGVADNFFTKLKKFLKQKLTIRYMNWRTFAIVMISAGSLESIPASAEIFAFRVGTVRKVATNFGVVSIGVYTFVYVLTSTSKLLLNT